MRKGNEITGSIKCEECGKITDWFYHIPDHSDRDLFHVNVIDKNKAGAVVTEGTRQAPKEFKIYCKNNDCGIPIFFKYNEETE